MTGPDWENSSRAFFDQRALQVTNVDLNALCFVSGRDARLWSDEVMYADVIDSIVTLSGVSKCSTLLEVGCASGFLAWGLSPRLCHYVGLDIAPRAVETAKKLKLKNAEFRVADGKRLSLADSSVDAAISYDVFTNFPSFAYGADIIREMLRVVRPGGRVLIGSIPDAARREHYEKRMVAVAAELEARYGPLPPDPELKPLGPLDRIRNWLRPVNPSIVCYYFNRNDFLNFGEELGVSVELTDIHPMNPYVGYRFNAIYTKNAI